MKKLSLSIFLTAFIAVSAVATEPVDRLPAIVIDTIYVSKDVLVVEYEVIRQFERISMSVQSSWAQTIKDVNPVLLSGSTGKSVASANVSLIHSSFKS